LRQHRTPFGFGGIVTERPLTADDLHIYGEIIDGIRAGNQQDVALGRACLQLVMRNAPTEIVVVLLEAIRSEAVKQSAATQN
jgi:hypothetical protein